ncbi:hypothetical protein LOD99_14318 [Oopsacas minuta]|uniref:Uncharacterized protein n=1 Tax=Oopsacas minuta TaxID=111878 RepID=A0AAV7KF76_9METZ|nr:hypothetical protein LOD99_14318 [Oopsacas minuta]
MIERKQCSYFYVRGDNEDGAIQEEPTQGQKLNKKGEIIPQQNSFSEKNNNARISRNDSYWSSCKRC